MRYWIIVTAIACSVYPAFVILRPADAVRLQRRRTSAASGALRSVGEFFGRMLRIDDLDAPYDPDGAAVARVRWFGIAELVVVWIVAYGLILITA